MTRRNGSARLSNAYIERFNRSDRTEVLNAHLFESIAGLSRVAVAGADHTFPVGTGPQRGLAYALPAARSLAAVEHSSTSVK